jgi:hypothetical protein
MLPRLALSLAFGLISANQLHAQALGCFVIEVAVEQPSALREQGQQDFAEKEPVPSVHPREKGREKGKTFKHAAPATPSLDDPATTRVKAFMLGQNVADYCGDIKIVETVAGDAMKAGGAQGALER